MIVVLHSVKSVWREEDAEALTKHFGKSGIAPFDSQSNHMRDDILYLTHLDLVALKAWNGGLLFQAPYVKVMSIEEALHLLATELPAGAKLSNPKDAIGIRKWRMISTLSWTVLAEVAVAMFEGAVKYGRHNYRVAGVRSSVYVDAAVWHIGQWWEGEDVDKDSGLSHITKAIASLFVLRDAMIQDMLNDDRPPRANLDQTREHLQKVVDDILAKYPEPKAPYTEKPLT